MKFFFYLFILLGNHSTIWKHNLDSPLHNVWFCVDQKSKMAATTELSLRWTHLCKWINYFFLWNFKTRLLIKPKLYMNNYWMFTTMFSFFVWNRMTTTTYSFQQRTLWKNYMKLLLFQPIEPFEIKLGWKVIWIVFCNIFVVWVDWKSKMAAIAGHILTLEFMWK